MSPTFLNFLSPNEVNAQHPLFLSQRPCTCPEWGPACAVSSSLGPHGTFAHLCSRAQVPYSIGPNPNCPAHLLPTPRQARHCPAPGGQKAPHRSPQACAWHWAPSVGARGPKGNSEQESSSSTHPSGNARSRHAMGVGVA